MEDKSKKLKRFNGLGFVIVSIVMFLWMLLEKHTFRNIDLTFGTVGCVVFFAVGVYFMTMELK